MVTGIELLDLQTYLRNFFFVCGWMKSEVYKRKVDTRDKLLSRILDAAACMTECGDQLRRTKPIFAHELQRTLKLAVGFANNCCEL
jgi:hypothetical protein